MGIGKVLLISPFASPNLGGVESHLDKLMDFLAKKNIFSYLITYQPLVTKISGEKVEKGKLREIHRVIWFGRGWFNKLEKYFPIVFAYLFPGLFIKSIIFCFKKNKEIDCVHAHGLVSAAAARLLKVIFKKRIVVSTHAVYNFGERKLLGFIVRQIFKSFDAVLAVSEVSRCELIKIGLAPQKIKVHPNWIDLNKFYPQDKEACKEKLKLRKNTILFVGRMIEKKGVGFLLKASQKFEEIDFVFVGSGPMEKEIQKTASGKSNVFFVGPIDQTNREGLEKLRCYYSAADVFACIPTYNEGFGAVYLESIACGTPVLSSNLGSLPTFLDDTVSVLIDPKQNKVEMAIKDLFADRRKREKLAGNCRKYAENNFSERNAEIILRSYYE